MEYIKDFLKYLNINKEWLFSGSGITIITAIFAFIIFAFKKIFKKKTEIEYIQTTINQRLKKEFITLYNPRSEFDDYFSFVVNQAKQNITLISITFGFISYPKLEKLINERNIEFNFYNLDKQSKYFNQRSKDINNKNTNDDYLFSSDIENLIKLKNKFPKKIKIFQYNSYPFWHYILIDNKKIYLSYHPIGKLGYKECNLFEVEEKISSDTFKLFESHIEVIKNESEQI
jgi:hypothetical protein